MTARKHQDEFIQFKGHTRTQRFQPPKPDSASLHGHNQASQTSTPKTNAQNQYRGHGRGQ
jgi:hypothetical protein